MFGMNNAEVTGQGIIPAERLFFSTQMTPYFLFSGVVDRVLMSREIIGPREDGIAGFSSRGVDSFALIRLQVSLYVHEIRR